MTIIPCLVQGTTNVERRVNDGVFYEPHLHTFIAAVISDEPHDGIHDVSYIRHDGAIIDALEVEYLITEKE